MIKIVSSDWVCDLWDSALVLEKGVPCPSRERPDQKM